jgi:hypothetical protein
MKQLRQDAKLYQERVTRGIDLLCTGAQFLERYAPYFTFLPSLPLAKRLSLAVNLLGCIPPHYRLAFYAKYPLLEPIGLTLTRISRFSLELPQAISSLQWPALLQSDVELVQFASVVDAAERLVVGQPKLYAALTNSV